MALNIHDRHNLICKKVSIYNIAMHSHFLLDYNVVLMHGDTPLNAEYSCYSVISHYKKETRFLPNSYESLSCCCY